jgi:hypothetical protein
MVEMEAFAVNFYKRDEMPNGAPAQAFGLFWSRDVRFSATAGDYHRRSSSDLS